jgi:putative transposase
MSGQSFINNIMSNLYQSLSHSKWNCKYHLIFVPKKRKSVIYGKIRQELAKILHELAKQKESQITEGNLSIDHVHMCIEIPPKYAVASVIGFLKGKSAIAIARMQGKDRNYTGAHFWARGYAVSTVGFDEEIIKKYIREQSAEDDNYSQVN